MKITEREKRRNKIENIKGQVNIISSLATTTTTK